MLDLIGAVGLLLWGLRLVKTGVIRSFGVRLRRWIGSGTRNRLLAFGMGLVATIALQSSTATALMTASFAGSGFMSSMMAQAIMLGANVGTSLVTRILAFDVHFLAPLMIALGVFAFGFSHSKPTKGLSRAVLGLGLMLLSLRLLGQATEPMQHSRVLVALMASLDAVPVLAVIVAAVLAIASSSSLAIVLLAMSLSASGTVTPALGIALVLGANLGGAVPPVLGTLRYGALARRVTIGNMLVRLIGCVAVLPFTETVARLLSDISHDPAALVVDTHIAFNILLAVIMLPILRPLSALMRRFLPEAAELDSGPRHLDPNSLDTPALALAGAVRETLRIGDCITTMLQTNLDALRNNDPARSSGIAAMDDEVDQLNSAVKLYLARFNSSALDETDEQRSNEIIGYATNLEHIGDIVDRNLRDMVDKKIRNQLSFSAEGAAEIEELYRVTLENLRLAQSILVTGDLQLARQLIESKVDIRHLEERSAANHMARLRDGMIDSLRTSSLHLDILRDLKRINAHIAAIAYPILKRQGALRESRVMTGEQIAAIST
ncbi:Na/Pi cotransporter family protein [Sinorhizobium meliloti]|uniref:Na/Pi cotransporter family protein n=1 Tax=Rhizobium meliloti TaxID=382 RepID=UPI00299ED55D|nr:Na/Pi cotransporter family protein [Sinorhizobium meliloti]MDW9527820.1 Na/Pi cotransporter family protein [Sinorhizobium meliloti]MDW9658840.1 Na/Pi cotransporter family protein [Sinorhizobium meliloti]MDW9881621.1 Na/Pi cotransporter family protein [Sinorhizobium meliloti]MDW9918806.1 Na/Pi cotransporter family protein [Sinorhizobium meliloti]